MFYLIYLSHYQYFTLTKCNIFIFLSAKIRLSPLSMPSDVFADFSTRPLPSHGSRNLADVPFLPIFVPVYPFSGLPGKRQRERPLLAGETIPINTTIPINICVSAVAEAGRRYHIQRTTTFEVLSP